MIQPHGPHAPTGEPHRHLIGLLLGAEEDWPTAFEALIRGLGTLRHQGSEHTLDTERVRIAPFDLRDGARQDVVIDRLAYWYYHPREWLKKVALMDDVYLLNSPFTFQAMEKHAAYCAMIRLGLHVPDTVLVPYKHPIDNVRWAYTAQHYNEPFELGEIAQEMGYPLYMKPFDGGAWRGVSRIRHEHDLWEAYNASGEMLMHLQKSVEPYEVFARALTIGPETKVMRFRPELPMHQRYAVDHEFLDADLGQETVTIAQTVNAFFRWEFNSCEMLVAEGMVHPIDYANACPDVAVTSLHYYFPWAISALVRWSAFCAVTERRPRLHVDTTDWFAVGDDPDLDYGQKLGRYQQLADQHFERERYDEFVAASLPHLDEQVYDYLTSADFEAMLHRTVASTYPEHEQQQFIEHFTGLLDLWRADNAPQTATSPTR